MTLPTAGPWKYHIGRGANPRFHIQTTAGYQIASTPEISRNAVEAASQEANARLISEAPELLFVLSQIIEALPTSKDWLDPVLEKSARALMSYVEVK